MLTPLRIPSRTEWDELPEADRDARLAELAPHLNPDSPHAKAVGESLFPLLLPTVAELARSVVPRDRGAQDELTSRALLQLLFPLSRSGVRKLPALTRYCPSRPFRVWCRRVLRNLRTDECRSAWNRRRERLDEYQAHRDTHAEAEHSTFTEAQLAIMESWPPKDRVLLSYLFGWWEFVPAGSWSRWRAVCPEAGLVCENELRLARDHRERMRLLADSTGIAANTLAQRCFRGKARVAGLIAVRRAGQAGGADGR